MILSSKRIFASAIILLFCGGICCTRVETETGIIISAPETQELVAEKVDFSHIVPLSLTSLLQANSKGLFLTPGNPMEGDVLYFINEEQALPCCIELETVISEGRGPGELPWITASSESFNSDTLLFYSSIDARLVSFNQEKTISLPDTKSSISVINPEFSFSRGYLFTPIDPQISGNDALFRLHDLSSNTSIDFFTPRVPIGLEPAIRNVLASSASLPDGFAIAFLGDRQIYILDYEGDIANKLVLGKSEPIGEPFPISNPVLAPSSTPYIPKMEYQDGKLFVLLDSHLWVIDYSNLEAELRLKILDDPAAEQPRVLDFSITEEMLYLRLAPNDIYKTPVRPDWLR